MSRHFVLALSFLVALPATTAAQTPEEPALSERLDRMLREMIEEFGPALEDALDYLRSFELLDDPRHYQLPEMLPNGDIIIRRREDAPPLPEPSPEFPIDPEEGIRI